MDKNFGGVVWTDHALKRLRERNIKQGDAWATWSRPEQSYKANLHKGGDAWRYYRTYGDQRIEVVARQDERKKWIIISVWSDLVYQNQKGKTEFDSQKQNPFLKFLKTLLGI